MPSGEERETDEQGAAQRTAGPPRTVGGTHTQRGRAFPAARGLAARISGHRADRREPHVQRRRRRWRRSRAAIRLTRAHSAILGVEALLGCTAATARERHTWGAEQHEERTGRSWPRRATSGWRRLSTASGPMSSARSRTMSFATIVREALTTARGVYGDLAKESGIGKSARKLATDKDLQESLRRALEELGDAADASRPRARRAASKKSHKKVLVAGILVGALYNPWTGIADAPLAAREDRGRRRARTARRRRTRAVARRSDGGRRTAARASRATQPSTSLAVGRALAGAAAVQGPCPSRPGRVRSSATRPSPVAGPPRARARRRAASPLVSLT